MKGTVFPRPHKRVSDKKGQLVKSPLRPNEIWTDSETGKVTTAGPRGSTWTYHLTIGSRKRGDRQQHTKGGFPTKKAAR